MDKKRLLFRQVQTIHQICRPVSSLYEVFLFCTVCVLAALLSREGKFIYIIAVLIALPYGLLTVRNERLEYNESGITLFSIWGKPFNIDWCDVRNVVVVEEPLVSKRLFVGHVLKIQCFVKHSSSVVTYRFPYRYYIGIDEFLSFYSSCIRDASDSV